MPTSKKSLEKIRDNIQKRLSPKMQRYAELRAQGQSATQAAKQAGYKSKAASVQCERQPLVRRYLDQIQSKAVARCSYSVAKAMDEAETAMELSHAAGQYSPYIKAVELRAKLSGLLIERHEVVTVNLSGALALAEARVLKQIQPAEQSLEGGSTGGSGAGNPAERVDVRDPSCS